MRKIVLHQQFSSNKPQRWRCHQRRNWCPSWSKCIIQQPQPPPPRRWWWLRWYC